MYKFMEIHGKFMGIHGNPWKSMGNSWKIHGKFMENSWKVHGNSWEFMETDSGEVDENQWICIQASADLVRRGYCVAGDTAENRSEVGWGT